MYPNYPPNTPYGAAPNMNPYGAGYPPQQQQNAPNMPYGMPQPFGAGPPMPSNFGMPGYGQQPAMPSYGQQPQIPPQAGFSQYPPAQQGFGGAPQNSAQPNYGYPGAPGAPSGMYGQQQPNAPPYPNSIFGSGQPEQIVQHQFAPSHSSPPSMTTASPVIQGRPTVLPAPNFNAANDAAALRKAMKGFGTDEDGLINILCRRPCAQRCEIVRAYKTAYGKDLLEDIRSETSGNFQNLLLSLCVPKYEFYCHELHEAISGAGTDEDALIDMMCTMSNQEIREINYMYSRLYGNSLENSLRSDTSGHMKRLLTSLAVGGRDESMRADVNSARQDAEALKRAGVDRWGTDESEFNRILCLRNYEQLKLICEEYQKLTGNDLEKDIKREFSGDIEDALLAIIRVARNRPEFFARRLHKSMAGLGTDDRALIRLVIMRCEIDMMDVKDEFVRYYGKTLKSFIKGDTSGHYKHALYALIGENRS